MFGVACFGGIAIGDARAGVVKLVDARDSKSRSARSVGSSPTARTILPDDSIAQPHGWGGPEGQADVDAVGKILTPRSHPLFKRRIC